MTTNLGFSSEQDLNTLLELFVELVQSQAGQEVRDGEAWLNDRQTLATKLYRHLHSMRQLGTGSVLLFRGQGSSFIDHSSVKVLARASLETYLVFYYIFGKNDLEESRFRHTSWVLGGLMDRQNFVATTSASQRVRAVEWKQVLSLREKLQSHRSFHFFTKKQQGKLLDGEWKTGKAWDDLAINAGFHPIYFRNIYSFLCGYSHSSYASALQVGQATEIESQRMLSGSMFGVACMLAAHFAVTYASMFERAQNTLEANPLSKKIAARWQFGADDMNAVYGKSIAD